MIVASNGNHKMADWILQKDADRGYRLGDGVPGGEGLSVPAIIGRAGLVAGDAKCEGDMATPVGRWALRHLYYRQDRVGTPRCALRKTAISAICGWCDDPASVAYNRYISLPFDASHETLWRQDASYDLVVMLGYNDAPPVAGRGSAIFLHCIAAGQTSTAGCVALARDDLLLFLSRAAPTQHIIIPDLP